MTHQWLSLPPSCICPSIATHIDVAENRFVNEGRKSKRRGKEEGSPADLRSHYGHWRRPPMPLPLFGKKPGIDPNDRQSDRGWRLEKSQTEFKVACFFRSIVTPCWQRAGRGARAKCGQSGADVSRRKGDGSGCIRGLQCGRRMSDSFIFMTERGDDVDDAEGRFDDEANHRGGTPGRPRYRGDSGRDMILEEGERYFSSFRSRQ